MSVRPMLCVIPARGGSKGLPGKNIRLLAGLPLIAHSIRCATMCPEITRLILSSDSEEISAVGRAHGSQLGIRVGEIRGEYLAVFGMYALGRDHAAVPPSGREAHQHRLGGRAAAVVETGV